MTSRRMPGWRLAAALVPVLLVSGAWTAGLAGSTATAGELRPITQGQRNIDQIFMVEIRRLLAGCDLWNNRSLQKAQVLNMQGAVQVVFCVELRQRFCREPLLAGERPARDGAHQNKGNERNSKQDDQHP